MLYSIKFDNQTPPFSFTEKVIQSKFYTTYLCRPGECAEKARSWKEFRPRVIARIAFSALILSPIVAPAGALWNWAQYQIVDATDSEKAKQYAKAAFDDLKVAGAFMAVATQTALIYGAFSYVQTTTYKILVLIGGVFSFAYFNNDRQKTATSGKEAATQTEVTGKDVIMQTEVLGKEAATQTEVTGKDVIMQTEVLGKEAATQTEVTGKDVIMQTEVLGKDAAMQTEVLGKDASMQTESEKSIGKDNNTVSAETTAARKEILDLYIKAQTELTDTIFQEVNVIKIFEFPFDVRQIVAKLKECQKTTELIQKLQQQQKVVEQHRDQYVKMGGNGVDLTINLYPLLPRYRETYAENISLAEFTLVKAIKTLNEQISQWGKQGIVCVSLPYNFPLSANAILERTQTILRNYGAKLDEGAKKWLENLKAIVTEQQTIMDLNRAADLHISKFPLPGNAPKDIEEKIRKALPPSCLDFTKAIPHIERDIVTSLAQVNRFLAKIKVDNKLENNLKNLIAPFEFSYPIDEKFVISTLKLYLIHLEKAKSTGLNELKEAAHNLEILGGFLDLFRELHKKQSPPFFVQPRVYQDKETYQNLFNEGNIPNMPVQEPVPTQGAKTIEEILSEYVKAQKDLCDIIFLNANPLIATVKGSVAELPFEGRDYAAKLEECRKTTHNATLQQEISEVIQKLQQQQKVVEQCRTQYLQMGGSIKESTLNVYPLLPQYRGIYAEKIGITELNLLLIIKTLNDQIALWRPQGVESMPIPYDFPVRGNSVMEKITLLQNKNRGKLNSQSLNWLNEWVALAMQHQKSIDCFRAADLYISKFRIANNACPKEVEAEIRKPLPSYYLDFNRAIAQYDFEIVSCVAQVNRLISTIKEDKDLDLKNSIAPIVFSYPFFASTVIDRLKRYVSALEKNNSSSEIPGYISELNEAIDNLQKSQGPLELLRTLHQKQAPGLVLPPAYIDRGTYQKLFEGESIENAATLVENILNACVLENRSIDPTKSKAYNDFKSKILNANLDPLSYFDLEEKTKEALSKVRKKLALLLHTDKSGNAEASALFVAMNALADLASKQLDKKEKDKNFF